MEVFMNKDRVAGAAKEAKGKVKQKIGKAAGDSKTEAEGAAERTEGKARNTLGKVKSKVRDVTR
jgi:uncharacterized protein YjbJ (UPF0337 family)